MRTLMVSIMAAALLAPAAWADELALQGKIDEVTVYRGQALVTRVLEVPGPGGLREILVTQLPEHIVPGSIYAESANGVEVRSVRYRVRPVREDVREEVSELDRQIREVQDLQMGIDRKVQLIQQERAYLDKLEAFVAPTASVELTKGVLNADTLREISTFQSERRRALSEEELGLELEKRDLSEKINLLQRDRATLAGSSSRTAREALIFANVQGDATTRLRVSYLVNNASWSPSYNARANAEQSEMLIESNASIQQMSGEDWPDVKMTLSTASPSLVAKTPILTPLFVSLAAPGKGQAASVEDYQRVAQELAQRRIQAQNERNLFNNGGEMAQVDSSFAQFAQQPMQSQFAGQNPLLAQDWLDNNINMVAAELQNYELMARGNLSKSAKHEPVINNEISVVYQLKDRTTLPSRTDRQQIQVAAVTMKGEFYKLAIPVLTNSVYDEASVVNSANMVLLGGPVATYLADRFVGHGEIPTVAAGERFTLGLGIDSSLRAGRELLSRNERIQGGNRIVDFKYRLAMENFGTEPVTVRLFDRMPAVKNNDIKLTMVEPGQPLSEDAAYRQGDYKKGILRWNVEVPAGVVGHEAMALDYQFQLEYDKQMAIAGMPLASAAQPAIIQP